MPTMTRLSTISSETRKHLTEGQAMQSPKMESFKRLTISAEKLPASMARQEATKNYAVERARILLGCYRTGDANDPETYVAAVAAVLSHFPEDVITEVTHPFSGLPRQKSWLPTVKEVFDACHKAAEPIYAREREAKIIAETLAARAEEDARQQERPTISELKEKHGENWGLTSLDRPERDPTPAPTWGDVAEYYKARPGRLQWLANRIPVLRGEMPDTPEPK
jgi:hypothetical protein